MRTAWRPGPDRLAALLATATASSPTYDEVRGTAGDPLPAGYAVLEDRAVVGTGRAAWERLAAALLGWELHREAGMLLAATDPRAEPGCTVVNAAPLGPLAVVAPCRVVDVVDQPERRGFAYGTLPGHPLVGEEQLTAGLGPAGVELRIRSFSRPSGLAGLASRLVRLGQHLVNRRYLAAARRLAA